MEPAARRVFVYGAPVYLTANINAAATGLVNGSKGYLHWLSWSDADASAEALPPPGSVGQLVEVPVPVSVNIFVPSLQSDDDEDAQADSDFRARLVPVFAQSTTKAKADALLSRQRHPFDLGFCITFHKVQGQTLNEVVLVLHRRRSRQLLKLCFEMLYVAVTRVRRTRDIRVLYFTEHQDSKPAVKSKRTREGVEKTRKRNNRKRPSITGLDHLLQLKRPRHFDA